MQPPCPLLCPQQPGHLTDTFHTNEGMGSQPEGQRGETGRRPARGAQKKVRGRAEGVLTHSARKPIPSITHHLRPTPASADGHAGHQRMALAPPLLSHLTTQHTHSARPLVYRSHREMSMDSRVPAALVHPGVTPARWLHRCYSCLLGQAVAPA